MLSHHLINKSKQIALLLILLLSIQFSFAQKAEIYGVVKDVSTNDVLPGATVAIVGTSIGTITDMNGEFRITNLNEGSYVIAYSYIGFLTEKLDVELVAGESKKMDMQMIYDAVDIGEIVVSTQILGQAKALNQQLNSDAIVSVVSSDKIKELPDANAAEAIGRLPGVSMARNGGEANKVIVRGLDPKLTSITINGIKMPASSSTDRSVDLSTISPELLSGIEVYKSPTADMDGDAIGGVVNLSVMKAPQKPVARFNLSGGYSGLDKNLGNYKTSFDLSKRYFNNKVGIALKGNYENTDRSSEMVSANWEEKTTKIGEEIFPDNYDLLSLKFTDNNRIINRIGANLGLDYQYASGQIVGQGFYSARNSETKRNVNDIDDGTTVDHLPQHSKSKNSTYQLLLDGKQRFNIVEMSWTLANSKTISDNYYDVKLKIQEYGGQFPDPEIGTAQSIDEKLAQRTYNFENSILHTYDYEPEIMEHDNNTAALNFKIDYSWGNNFAGFLKFGGKYRIDNRTNVVDYYTEHQYSNQEGVNRQAVDNMSPTEVMVQNLPYRIMGTNFASGNEDVLIWDGQYRITPSMDMGYLDLWHDRNFSSINSNNETVYKNYSAKESISAFYVMAKLKYSNWLTFIPGVRYEYADNTYSGVYSTLAINNGGFKRDTTTYSAYGELLPSAHLKISPVKWFDARFSAVKTLARPDYNMITPRSRIDIGNGKLWRGNPDIQHALAWNYDAVLSFFSNKLGLFTIGGFYKKIDNYFAKINRVMSEEESKELGYPTGTYEVPEDYMNFDDSEVYGFEIDLQTNFSFLPQPFNGIVVNANVTRLWSKTSIPLYNKVEVWDDDLRRNVVDFENSYFEYLETTLPDQTELTTNLAIGYDYKGFSSRISMIYQTEYRVSLSAAAEADSEQYSTKYNNDFLRFDLSVSQKIGEHIKIRANWANFTGQGESKYLYLPNYMVSENRYGMTFDLGMQYKF